MPNKVNDQEISLLQKHLSRAQDLGVELDEYAAFGISHIPEG